MANRIWFIDGTGEAIEATTVDGLEDIVETLELTDSKAVAFSTSSEILIGKGAAYDLLLETFFNCDSLGCISDGLKVDIYFECCDITKRFKILPEFIEYCFNECYFKVKLSSSSEAEEKLNCLKDSYFWSNGFLDTLTINDIPQFDWENPVSGFIGHVPAIPIRKILDFNLERCGLILCSTILDNPLYANLALGFDSFQVFPTIFRHGLEVKKPTLDTLDILDRLAVMFNAEYRIINEDGLCKLVFERRDFFTTPLKTLKLSDFITDDEGLCVGFESNDKQLCKSTDFRYDKSGVFDFVTETAATYNYVKNWQSNVNRTETCKVEVGFHSPAFDDSSGLMRYILSDEIDENTPLIFAWDGSNIVNAQTFNSTACGYNYPISFIEDTNCDNLYPFHAIDNPDELGCALEVKQSIEICPKLDSDNSFCSINELINQYGLQLAFEIDEIGCNGLYIFPQQLSINYGKNTISLEEPIVI